MARFSCRSPFWLRRCGLVSPDEAGVGETPATEAEEIDLGRAALGGPADQDLGGDDRCDTEHAGKFGSS
ncbi:hypothetical protein ABT272_43950, partial [Streptomyces sp900105245]